MKIKFYSLLLFFLVIFSGNAQVLIGMGTNTQQFAPFNPYWNYTYTQSIYLNSEINASGNITSIQWYFKGATPTINSSDKIVIYLGTTSKTSFTSTSDWVPVANMTKVFDGTIVMDSPLGDGWKTITFTTPFAYDNTKNLVIATNEIDPGSEGLPGLEQRFYNSAVSDNRTIYARGDASAINPASPPVANNTRAFVPNIILGGITQACETPQYLVLSAITQTTATVTWENLARTTPSNGSEYYLTTLNNKPNENTSPTGSVPNGLSANLTNLQPGTTYFVYVRNNCGNGEYSDWSPSVKLTTNCPNAIENFYENFDTNNTTPSNLPNCWTKILRANTGTLCPSAKVQTNTGETNSYSAPNYVAMQNCNSTGDYDIILVSPELSNLNESPNRLIFYSKGAILEVGTLDKNTDDAKFTLYKSFDESSPNEYTNWIIDFKNYVGTDKYIGIRMKTSNPEQSYANIDNVSWSYNPTCPDVTQVNVVSVSADSATIGWSDAISGEATSWDIAYGSPSVNDPNTLPYINTIDSGAYTIEGLQSSTQYKAWVRSVCSGNDKGAYVGPVLFKTGCPIVANFNENFNGTPIDALPQCWSKVLKPNNGELLPLANVAVKEFNVFNGTKCVSLTSGNSEGDYDVILVSPQVSTLAPGSNYRLRFLSRFSTDKVEIGTMSSSTNSGIFTLFQTVNFNDTGALEEYIVDFSTYDGTDEYIAFRMPNIPGQGFAGISLDNIVWQPVPTCPEVTDVKVINTYETAATVNWQSTPTESSWDITYGPSTATEPESGFPILNTFEFPYTITNLAIGTTYNVWVRANCEGEGKGLGEWIGPVSFATECEAVGPFTENFDNPATTTLPNMPTCWTKIMRGPGLSQFATINTTKIYYPEFLLPPHKLSSPNCVIMTAQGSSKQADLIMVSPKINNLRGKNRLKFDTEYPGRIQIGTLDGNTNNAKFTVFKEILLSSSPDGNGGYVGSSETINFTNYQGSDTHIGIRLMPNPDAFAEPDPAHPEDFIPGFPSVWFDNFVWEPIPGCVEVSNVKIDDVAITTAATSWTAGQGETQWEVVYDLSTVTNPDNIAKINTVTGSPNTTLTNLAGGTSYKLWVRAVCGDSNSAWVGPVLFTTECISTDVPYIQDFNSAVVPAMPNCTSEITVGSGPDWRTSNPSSPNDYTYDSIKLQLIGDFNTSSNAWFFTQGINLTQGEKYYISYKYGSNSPISAFLKNLKVKYGTSNTPEGMTLELANYPFYYGYDNTDKIVFTAPSTNVYYFGFYAYSDAGSGFMFLDNIKIDKENLSLEDFDNSNFSYYPNPVKNVLNLSYINKISAVNVYNLLGQKINVSTYDNNTKIDMSALANGTYMIKINSENQQKTLKVIKE